MRVHAVAMNHMDLWVRRGGPAFKLEYPHRLGCDIAGTVEELGPGARGVLAGDRVMVQPGLSCGICRACLVGHDNLCRRYRILGENAQGGYARHIDVPDENVLRIGDALAFDGGRGAAALHADGVADGRSQGAGEGRPDGGRARGGERRVVDRDPALQAAGRARDRHRRASPTRPSGRGRSAPTR